LKTCKTKDHTVFIKVGERQEEEKKRVSGDNPKIFGLHAPLRMEEEPAGYQTTWYNSIFDHQETPQVLPQRHDVSHSLAC